MIADASIDPDATVAVGGGDHGVNLYFKAADLFAELSADVADVTKPG